MILTVDTLQNNLVLLLLLLIAVEVCMVVRLASISEALRVRLAARGLPPSDMSARAFSASRRACMPVSWWLPLP